MKKKKSQKIAFMLGLVGLVALLSVIFGSYVLNNTLGRFYQQCLFTNDPFSSFKEKAYFSKESLAEIKHTHTEQEYYFNLIFNKSIFLIYFFNGKHF